MQIGTISRAELAANIPKPAHGQPCNSCGLCCIVGVCDLGAEVFGEVIGRCPALERESDGSKRFRCGLVANPGKYHRDAAADPTAYSAAALLIVAGGIGCDTRLIQESRDEPFNVRLRQWRRSMRDRALVALALWGVTPWRAGHWWKA